MRRCPLMLLFALVFSATQSWAATIYKDASLVSDCTSGNYSIASRNCTGSDGNAYNDFVSAIAPMVAGDTLYIRGGTHIDRIDLQAPNKSGAPGAYMTFAGYPGETAIIRYTDPNVASYGAIKSRGNRGYFIFQDFEIDGIDMAEDTSWAIRDGNHHFIIRRLRIYNQNAQSALYISGNDIIVEDNYFGFIRSDCSSGNRSYAVYAHDGARLLVQRNEMTDNPGGGAQIYPGPWTDVQFLNNHIHHTNTCASSSNGGIVVGTDTDPDGGDITGVILAGNIINNINVDTSHGIGAGIRVYNNHGGARVVDGTLIHNNTIYKVFNNASSGSNEYCVHIATGSTNTDVTNNIMTECGGNGSTVAYLNNGTGTTTATNACKGTENCPSKVTITDAFSCLVDPDNGDFRLQNSTNPCLNAGTSVDTRPIVVNLTDIGAYEQGELASASVVSGIIEATISVMTPGLVPSSGILGFSLACVGCTGSPVVVAANVKSGSDNIVQLTVSGITSPGTCTITLGSTNMTDSLFIGGPTGNAQFIRSIGDTVSGTCDNSPGGALPGNPIAYYKLNEGVGTLANDETVNNNDGGVSTGVSWATVYQGTGLRVPTDATFRHLNVPSLGPLDPSAADFGTCAIVKPDTLHSQKVVASFGGNGVGQRLYVGFVTVGGQLQWGIGVQGSGFSTGSEFPATAQLTFVCLVGDATANTVTLWVNGVKGTGTNTSVKSVTSYTTVGTLRYGNDGSFSTNNGGFDLDEVYVWNTKPSDADIQTLYATLFPAGASLACYKQQDHQWQRVYTNASFTPENIGLPGASVEVVANGAVALVIQVDCVGSAGVDIAFRPRYSIDGTNFNLPIPDTIGADNISMWGLVNDPLVNQYAVGCCISGALTPNSGVTLVEATVSPTIALAQNHSYVLRLIIRVGNIAGQSRYIRLYQDNGAVLIGGYTTTPEIRVVPPMASVGFP